VIKDLSNFDSTDQELVAKSFQEVAIVIRSRVYDGISKHIRLWEEQEKQLQQVGDSVTSNFKDFILLQTSILCLCTSSGLLSF
jgi:hypothetical protein